MEFSSRALSRFSTGAVPSHRRRAQELAHHGDWAVRIQHEVGKPRRLVDPPPDSHAGQRDHSARELAPAARCSFPLVVPHLDRRFPVRNSMSFSTASRSTACRRHPP